GQIVGRKVSGRGGGRAASPRSCPLAEPARDARAQPARARPSYPMISALLGARGYAHAEVSAALERSRQLVAATAATGTPLHFSVLYGVWVADTVRGNLKGALEHAQQFLALAERQPDSGPRLIGHRLLGNGLLFTGDFRQARPHLELAASLYR